MQPPSKGRRKVDILCPGHITKMTVMSVYGKTLKNLLLKNHWADCLETWYVASCIANIILATLPYIYKRSISSYPKQISLCILGAQGSDQDLIILLLYILSMKNILSFFTIVTADNSTLRIAYRFISVL